MSWDYFDKFEYVTGKYLPSRGEGNTMATQIVTAVNKLVYKWYNDGDVYDNTKYLEGWANDLSSYANWLYYNAEGAFVILSKVWKAKTEDDYELILTELADKLLDDEVLEVYNRTEKVGSIYECDGPFEFIEPSEEDEDW